MYISSSEMRAAGRADLSGRWGESAMLTFVLIIITCFVNGTVGQGLNLWFAGLGSLTTILLLPMGWGYSVSFLINHRGAERDPFDLDCLFTGYKKCSRIFTTLILKNLIVVLGLVLLIVPGIYFALAYAMTDYLLFDNPELKNQAALRRSKEMMVGHKTELLWLWLSFIGWAILCLLTLGIGFFWLQPYVNSSMANFYETVKSEYEAYAPADEPIYEEAAPAEEPASEAPTEDVTSESSAGGYDKTTGTYEK